MGIEYVCTVNATSNSTLNTEDTFIEISGVVVKIKRVTVRLGNPTTLATAGNDGDTKIRLVRKTAGGATGTGGTIVRMNQMGRTSGATVNVKNGTSAFTTATLGDIIKTEFVNGRATWEWVARDEDNKIITHPTLASGGMFAVLIMASAASLLYEVTVHWEEV